MGKVREVSCAALIAGILYSDNNALETAVRLLEEKFGPITIKSEAFDFNMTDYYSAEMGKDLKKIFCCFENPVALETLPDIKLTTNEMELRLAGGNADNPRRRANIDPGYVTLSKLVLVTTKDYSHRVFIGKGIYAETTLRFIGRTFTSVETTYPDYRTPFAINFFNTVREFVKENRVVWNRKKELRN